MLENGMLVGVTTRHKYVCKARRVMSMRFLVKSDIIGEIDVLERIGMNITLELANMPYR